MLTILEPAIEPVVPLSVTPLFTVVRPDQMLLPVSVSTPPDAVRAPVPLIAWLTVPVAVYCSTPLVMMLLPEIVAAVPCRVAPALTVVEPVQLLALLVRTMEPRPPMTTGWAVSPPPRVSEPLRVAVIPASARKVLGSALAGEATDSRMLLA